MEERKVYELIEEFCTDYSHEFYDGYSGRGMYGKTCAGIICDSCENYITLAMQLTVFLMENGIDDPVYELGRPSIDALGMDTILYFPIVRKE